MELVRRFMEDVDRNGFFVIAAQIRKDGGVVDEWTRFEAKPRFETYSVSKTFVAAAAGIAIHEGLIRLDEKLIDSFPDESRGVEDPNAADITVKDLLTMTSGLSESMMWRDGYERKYESDWIRFFYTHGKFDNRPGTVFKYNNANPYMLGCLIEKKSGQNVREYLRHRLFEPVGIHNPEWMDCPKGHTVAANGLAISIDEMGRFGQLLVNGGVYDGKRILDEEYVRSMFVPFTADTGEVIPGDSPSPVGYGYQTWIDTAHNAGYMWGVFGQYCVMLPRKNAVVSVISLEKTDGGSNGDYGVSLLKNLIWEDMVDPLA